MPQLPTIHAREESDIGPYRLERLDLEFSNGERRRYERLKSRGHGAVMIAALPDPNHVLLIREYAAGTHRYELGLPKGRMDAGEVVLQAANRELMEEVGQGARTLTHIRGITLAPVYMNHEIQLVVAEDLYEKRLPGDEPEPMEVLPWRLDRLHELMLLPEFSEGRSIAALYLVRDWLAMGRPR